MDQAQKSKIDALRKEAKEAVRKVSEDSGMRYVAQTPTKQRSSWVLAHNHVRHTADMGIGRNGFRAWWFTKAVPKGFKPCHCGWSELPHVSARPDYKCEPERLIVLFD